MFIIYSATEDQLSPEYPQKQKLKSNAFLKESHVTQDNLRVISRVWRLILGGFNLAICGSTVDDGFGDHPL